MKKIIALCSSVMLLMGAAFVASTTVARAQASGPFADVPTDHWAYQAVDTLQKAGIVIGYPDGTYGGKRPMTRYEFAVAIARLLPLIQPPDMSTYATKGDLAALQDDVNNKLQQNAQALAALTSLVNEFQPELQQLGQDVAAIKARLDALEDRVAALEYEQGRVIVTGNVNMVGIAGVATGHPSVPSGITGTDGVTTPATYAPPVDLDGYRVGNPYNNSIFDNPNVYEDVLLGIQGRVSDTAKAVVDIEAGNYASSLGSTTSQDPFRTYNDSFEEGDGGLYYTPAGTTGTSFDLYKAYLEQPVNTGLFGKIDVTAGRFGEQFTPWTYEAIDPDSYSNLPETDSGDQIVDGVKVAFKKKFLSENFFFGKNSTDAAYTTTGGPGYALNGPYRPGSGSYTSDYGYLAGGSTTFYPNEIDQSAGSRTVYGNPNVASIGLTVLQARVLAPGATTGAQTQSTTSNDLIDPESGKPYNNLEVYGVDYAGALPIVTGATVTGQYTVSGTGLNNWFGSVNGSHRDAAWNALIAEKFGSNSLKGGYEVVDPFFAAPGFWDKIGVWTDPTNIKGWTITDNVGLTPSLGLYVKGDWYKGEYTQYETGYSATTSTGASTLAAASPLGSGDELNHFNVGLTDKLTSNYNVDLGYEYVQWQLHDNYLNLAGPGKFEPTESYTTFGLGHDLSKNSSVKLLYQIISYNDKDSGFDPAGNSKGGVAATQFSLKF